MPSALVGLTGATSQIRVRNIADCERSHATDDVDGRMKDCFAIDPDLAVLAIGEDVPPLTSENAKAQFKAGVTNILGCAMAKRDPRGVRRSCFWATPAKDEVLSPPNAPRHQSAGGRSKQEKCICGLDCSMMIPTPTGKHQ